MTNYEWLVKNKPELVKEILSKQLGKVKGIPKFCYNIGCNECEFYNRDGSLCGDNAREWLKKKYEPLYKKGDVVIDSYNQLAVIKEGYYGGDLITISHYADNTTGVKVLVNSIKKKVGHTEIEETDEPSLCDSCKNKACLLQTGVVRRHCDFYKAGSASEIS